MSRYFLSADADEDLQDVYLYSEDNWGERQARRYLTGLYDVFERLGAEPAIGRLRGELGEAIRSFRQGEHLVFFMEWEDEIAILRVLHGRMDIEHAFDGYDPLPGIAVKRPS